MFLQCSHPPALTAPAGQARTAPASDKQPAASAVLCPKSEAHSGDPSGSLQVVTLLVILKGARNCLEHSA